MVRAGNRVGATPVDPGARLRSLGRGHASLEDAVRGKVVLVTGASSGIGRASALRLGRAGATVLVVARTPEALDEVVAEIAASGGHAEAYPCDLSDLDAIDALVGAVLAAHGAVDVLVNNAGKSIRRRISKSVDRFQDFTRPMQLNYFGSVRLTLGLLPEMIASGSGQVVNISTWAVTVRPPRFSGYVASKAALEAWSDSVQAELLDSGVVFTTIRMPLVRTPMIAPTAFYKNLPAISAEEAGKVVTDAIVSRSRRVTPLAATVPSVIDALSPRLGDRVRRLAP